MKDTIGTRWQEKEKEGIERQMQEEDSRIRRKGKQKLKRNRQKNTKRRK